MIIKAMTDEKLREFVLDYCDGHIFTDADEGMDHKAHLVFMPVIFMKKEDLEELSKQKVVVFGNLRKHKTTGRAVNGFPIFAECEFILADDYLRAHKAIIKELERRKSIEV